MFGIDQRTHQRGFSLLETMISAGLLAIGVLGTVALQVTAIHGNRFGIRTVQALTLAEAKLAELASLPTTDGRLFDANTGNNPGGLNGPFKAVPASTADPSSFADGIDPQPLDESGAPMTGANFGNGLGFQRFWQIAAERLNPAVLTVSAVRIQVVVRYRDEQSGTYRSVAVQTLRSFNL